MLLTVNHVGRRRWAMGRRILSKAANAVGKLTLACQPNHAIAIHRFNADVFGLVDAEYPFLSSWRSVAPSPKGPGQRRQAGMGKTNMGIPPYSNVPPRGAFFCRGMIFDRSGSRQWSLR
jgi:hypothetical protein